MKTNAILAALLTTITLAHADPVTTTFTYHGVLNESGVAANGNYDFKFRLYDAASGGTLIGGVQSASDLPVNAGLFVAELNFGDVFDGNRRWLEIGIRPGASTDAYATVSPRIEVTVTSHALWAKRTDRAASAGVSDSVNWSGIVGLPATFADGIDNENTYSAGAGLALSGDIFRAAFAGNGIADTVARSDHHHDGTYALVSHAHSAGDIASGVLADEQIGPAVARLSQIIPTVLGNDGADSGLDADQLDGLDSTAFARANHAHSGSGHGSTQFGAGNASAGFYSTVSGGRNNRSIGDLASVPGGAYNEAWGDSSFAAGNSARALHDGCFVWADFSDPDNPDFSYESTAPNQFCVRALGGVHLSGRTSQFFGATTRQMLNLWNTDFGIGVQADTLYQRSNWRFSWYRGGTHAETQNDPGGGVVMMTLDPAGLTVNGTFVNSSDRNAKENFSAVDSMAVLDQVSKLPISRWNYKEDRLTRHIGPMAQDFHAAFQVGADDKHIATVDADGIALAAIQALNRKVEELSALQQRVQSLEAKAALVESLFQRLEALESKHPILTSTPPNQ